AEELNPDEQASVESHIESCTQCQSSLNNLTLLTSHRESWNVRPGLAERRVLNPETEAFFEELKRKTAQSGKDASGKSPGGENAAGLVQIDGYDIYEEIGRGAVGVVYRGLHRK